MELVIQAKCGVQPDQVMATFPLQIPWHILYEYVTNSAKVRGQKDNIFKYSQMASRQYYTSLG
jgi:hypothetical protein